MAPGADRDAGRGAATSPTPRTRRSSPSRSVLPCSSSSTASRRPSASPSSCTTCSRSRSTRSRGSSTGRPRPPASWRAAPAAVSARRRPSLTPTSRSSGRWSTRSSPRRAPGTSPRCSRSSTPTSCSAPTAAAAGRSPGRRSRAPRPWPPERGCSGCGSRHYARPAIVNGEAGLIVEGAPVAAAHRRRLPGPQRPDRRHVHERRPGEDQRGDARRPGDARARLRHRTRPSAHFEVGRAPAVGTLPDGATAPADEHRDVIEMPVRRTRHRDQPASTEDWNVRNVPHHPGHPDIGQLAIVFAALLVGIALMAALAYGPLTSRRSRSPRPPPRRPRSRTTTAGAPRPWGPPPAVTPAGSTPRRSVPAAGGNTFDKAHAPGAASRAPKSAGSARTRSVRPQ